MKYELLIYGNVQVSSEFAEGVLIAAIQYGAKLQLPKQVLEYLTKPNSGLSGNTISAYRLECESEVQRLMSVNALIEIKTFADTCAAVLAFIETSFDACKIAITKQKKDLLVETYRNEKCLNVMHLTNLGFTDYPANFVVWTNLLSDLHIVRAFSDKTDYKNLIAYKNE